jgi:hypothetical protein
MSKRYLFFLSIVSALLLSLLLMLCFYSRLATDDYYFIWDVRHTGILGDVYSQYTGWCGRYAATFLVDIFYRLLDIDQTWYFLWPLISVIAMATGIFSLFSAFAVRSGIIAGRKEILLLSFSFLSLLFFFSVDIGETWMWYCSLSSYLWSVIAFTWGMRFLLSENRFVSIPGALLCFIYVGGASEVYSVIYGVAILAFLVIRYKKAGSSRSFIQQGFNRKLIVAYAFLGIAFIILVIAPGNYLRDELFPEHHIGKALFITAKSIVKFSVLYVPFRLVYLLAFAVPFVLAGKISRQQQSMFRLSFGTFFMRATAVYISLLFLFFLLVAYVMVETGPPRLWFMVAFLSAVYCTSVCFYAGYSGIISDAKLHLLKRSGILLAALVLSWNLFQQFNTCRSYTKALDTRLLFLKNLNEKVSRDTLIVVPPLPSSGMLYSAEIKADTNHFTNRELRIGFDLKFHVVTEK